MLIAKEQVLDSLSIPHAQDLSSDDILKIVSFCRIQTLDKSDLEWSEISYNDDGNEMPQEIKQCLQENTPINLQNEGKAWEHVIQGC